MYEISDHTCGSRAVTTMAGVITRRQKLQGFVDGPELRDIPRREVLRTDELVVAMHERIERGARDAAPFPPRRDGRHHPFATETQPLRPNPRIHYADDHILAAVAQWPQARCGLSQA